MKIIKGVGYVLFYLLVIQKGSGNIISPEDPLICQVGDNAFFNWTTDDGRKIFSVNWGIKNGNSEVSQFINTNVYTKIVNYNKNMDPKYRDRVSFVGNLTMGRAWFLLKNATMYDERKYVANIYESQGGVLAYFVRLKVKERVYSTWTTKMVSHYNTENPTTSFIITNASTKNFLNDSFSVTSGSPTKDFTRQYYGVMAALLLSVIVFATCLLV